jgi:glucosamine-6-phosphate deaminase
LKTIRCGRQQDLHAVFLDLISDALSRQARTTLALATGRTYVPLYHAVADHGALSLGGVRAFALDELRVDGGGAPFRDFLIENLVSRTDLSPSHLATPDPGAADTERECAEYERAIEEAGGIDLALLGIGANGHIGFNEPGSPFTSRTRLVPLTDETRAVTAEAFGVEVAGIRGALTMGLATIMEARRILLVATGREKAEAIRAALGGPVTEDVPASILRLHENLTVLMDSAASSKLD